MQKVIIKRPLGCDHNYEFGKTKLLIGTLKRKIKNEYIVSIDDNKNMDHGLSGCEITLSEKEMEYFH